MVSIDLATLLITGLVFAVDLLTPTGVTVGILYVAPVLATLRSTRSASTFQIAALSSLLLVVATYPLPSSAPLASYVLANRLLALIAIWVTAVLVRTYRHRTAEAARLAALVTSSDDAIIGTTLDGIIETWNAGAEELYGYRAEEIIGKSVGVLLPDDRKNELHDILKRLKQGDHVEHFETVRKTKDGRVRHVALTVSPILDQNGMMIGASKIAQDITPQKEAEQERARLLRDLQDALAKVKRLEGLLPVCSSCKKIRDSQGHWVPFEAYITEHSEAVFSHGYCPSCLDSTLRGLKHNK